MEGVSLKALRLCFIFGWYLAIRVFKTPEPTLQPTGAQKRGTTQRETVVHAQAASVKLTQRPTTTAPIANVYTDGHTGPLTFLQGTASSLCV